MGTQLQVEKKCETRTFFKIRKVFYPLLVNGRPVLDEKGEPERRIMYIRTLFLHNPTEVGGSGWWKVSYVKRTPATEVGYDGLNQKPVYGRVKPEVTFSISTIPQIQTRLERGN